MWCLDVLQDIHVVGDGGTLVVAADAVIPCGPGALAAGQDGVIGVQDDVIAAVGEAAEDADFVSGGLFEQCECLIAVAGKHNFIEGGFGGVCDDGDCRGGAADASDRCVGDDAIGERLDQAVDIIPRTTGDGVPLRAVGQAEQSVIAVEFENELDGEIGEGAHWAGPDGCSHGQQVVFREAAAESAATQVLSDGFGGADEFSVAGAEGVEPENIENHAKEGGAEQAGALGKEAVEAGAAVFEAGAVAADSETHFRGHAGDVQQPQQLHEQGVGAIVVDDETDVDGVVAVVEAELHGATVASGLSFGFEDGHIMLL